MDKQTDKQNHNHTRHFGQLNISTRCQYSIFVPFLGLIGQVVLITNPSGFQFGLNFDAIKDQGTSESLLLPESLPKEFQNKKVVIGAQGLNYYDIFTHQGHIKKVVTVTECF